MPFSNYYEELIFKLPESKAPKEWMEYLASANNIVDNKRTNFWYRWGYRNNYTEFKYLSSEENYYLFNEHAD